MVHKGFAAPDLLKITILSGNPLIRFSAPIEGECVIIDDVFRPLHLINRIL